MTVAGGPEGTGDQHRHGPGAGEGQDEGRANVPRRRQAPDPGDEDWPARGPGFASPSQRSQVLSGRVAVVTGASRGLGAGLAAHFAAAGLRLGLCARHRPELVAATRPRAHDGRIDPSEPPLVAAVDVGDPEALSAFAEAVVDRFGRIDLWVNNAGLLEPVGPLVEAEVDDVAAHLEVNVNGVFYGSMLFARHVHVRPGEGVLVNVTSGAARRPYVGWAPYCASKAAVDRLTEVLAQEEWGHGLRAYAVSPGLVDTDMQALIRATDDRRFPEAGRFRTAKADGAFNSSMWVADKLLELAFGDHPVRRTILRVPPDPASHGAR